MLLKRCLMTYRDTLSFVYLSLCLRLGLSKSYLCDLFFLLSFSFSLQLIISGEVTSYIFKHAVKF